MPRSLYFVALIILFITPSQADPISTKPLWELGGIVGVGRLPHYPGSDQSRLEILPLPYFIYRGKVIRSDDKGILRGRLFVSENIELDISLAGALEMNSKDNRARSGMPDLDWMGELGPRLQITLARAGPDVKIDFGIPTRAVVSTDFTNLKYVGLISVPEIAYHHENLGGLELKFKLGVGAIFGDVNLQKTIFGVDDRFATATRPAYEAKSGYMGSRVQISFSHYFNSSLRVVGALRADIHHGAVNEKSPLLLKKNTQSLGIAIIWSMLRSGTHVDE